VSLEYDGATFSLVVNPNAGHGKAKKLLGHVTATILTKLPGVNLRVYQTASFAEARLRCIEAVGNARGQVAGHRPDSLLVMGGDGMMHLGLNACAATGVPLGLIPAGSGNDFCRGVGIPTGFAAALDVIVAGNLGKIDLMEMTGDLAQGARRRWAGSILSSGFDARVNARVNRMKWTLGSLSYTWAALAELSIFEPLNYRLLVDGKPLQQTAMFICVGSAGYFGGGMHGLPFADVRDGLLDLTIINPVSRMTLLRLLPAMFTGAFVRDPAVRCLRAREVVVDGDGLIAYADGEDVGKVPITLRAVPDALTLYLPEAK
jgi:diacylglycerol kinase (ATP)